MNAVLDCINGVASIMGIVAFTTGIVYWKRLTKEIPSLNELVGYYEKYGLSTYIEGGVYCSDAEGNVTKEDMDRHVKVITDYYLGRQVLINKIFIYAISYKMSEEEVLDKVRERYYND